MQLPTTLSDPRTEDQVLGALLTAGSTEMLDLLAILADDPGFTHPVRSCLYDAIGKATLTSAGHHDMEALRAHLIDSGFTRGPDDDPTWPDAPELLLWMLQLDQHAPVMPNERRGVAERLVELKHRRRRFEALQTITRQLLEGTSDAATAAAMVAEGQRASTQTGDMWADTGLLAEAVAEHWDALFTSRGAVTRSTGSAAVDKITYGIGEGHTWILAGRPGQGKSVAAMDMVRSLLKQGFGVLVFSHEMTAVDIMGRLAAAESGFNVRHAIHTGDEDGLDQAMEKTLAHGDRWRKLLKIADATAGVLTWQRMATEVRRQKAIFASQGITLAMFVVDYLQVVPQSQDQRPQLSVREHISAVTQSLSALAKETNVTFLGVSQLRRPGSTGEIKPPTMFELKESSDLEQSADVIVLLHRPDQYDAQDRPGRVDWNIGKHRHGEVDVIERGHQLQFYRMVDLARDWQTPPADDPEADRF